MGGKPVPVRNLLLEEVRASVHGDLALTGLAHSWGLFSQNTGRPYQEQEYKNKIVGNQ
jgi:hypothetical protein